MAKTDDPKENLDKGTIKRRTKARIRSKKTRRLITYEIEVDGVFVVKANGAHVGVCRNFGDAQKRARAHSLQHHGVEIATRRWEEPDLPQPHRDAFPRWRCQGALGAALLLYDEETNEHWVATVRAATKEDRARLQDALNDKAVARRPPP